MDAAAMATMRRLLSEIDVLGGLRPARVSAGDVVYPPGGRLGPRWQHDVQLVLVHTGSASITVDGTARAIQGGGSAGLLLPGHREHFAFADDGPTRHSWVQARLAEPPDELIRRLAALPAAMPASTALTELVREAVAVARTPLSTASPLLAALAAAALWRYAGEAESRVRGPDDAVARARSFLHAELADPGVDLGRVAPAARTGFKSVYHFSRRVKEQAGASPTAVRRERWRSAGKP